MLPRNISTSAPLLDIFGFGNLVLFGSGEKNGEQEKVNESRGWLVDI